MREDWVKATIDDVIHDSGIFKDGDWVESKDQDQNGEIRLIQLADIGDGIFLNKSERYLTKIKAQELKCTYLKEGDILVARMPYPLGRATIFPLKGDEKHVTVVDVAIIRLNNDLILQKYFLYIINSPISRKEIEKLQSGTTRKRISRKNLSTILFPIAPFPEQRAIVAKIEELFSKLDNGISNLNKAKEKLEIYRQAVLKKAFDGELTKEWRKENLIGDIENVISSSKSFKELCYANWRYERLSEVSDAIGGYAFKSNNFRKDNGEFQVVRIGNIRPGKLRLNESPVYINNIDESILSKYELKLKDVIITLTGTRKKRDYGYTTIVNKAKLLLNQRIAALRFNEKCLPEFFLYYSWTDNFKNQFFESETGNVGQGNVGMKAIRETIIPLPTIEEQLQIVSKIEEKLSVCDDIEKSLYESLKICDILRQSILRKAFEGKLLNELEIEACKKEFDWEPADKLLEKIKKLRLSK